MCCCPAHADRTPSLSITLGKRAVLVHCFAGCNNEAVMQGMAKRGVRLSDLFGAKGEPVSPKLRDEIADRNALRLWSEASILAGSPAERYLLGRGITVASPDLRFHPLMPLGPKGAVRFLPALVSAVRNDAGVLALHRTFLDSENDRLAAFEQPKRALGSLGAGAVRLAWPRGGRLGVAEGVETALSAMQLFGISCWATLGNERFGLVTIPESVRELHLFVDNDAGGRLAEERAREAYACEGRRIVTRPPERSGDDWNDVLLSRQRAAV
ncbi:MAG: virulence protein [Sphingomonadaceae bacterium]|nr:virulence protein [Sphingomonadaceae bacterium]